MTQPESDLPLRDQEMRSETAQSTEVERNTVRLHIPSHFTEKSLRPITDKLLQLELKKPDSQVEMYISTTGGSVSAVTELAFTMRQSSLPISTTAVNYCHSAGVFLVAAGDPGRRFAYEDTEFMFHPPRYTREGEMTADRWVEFAQRKKDQETTYLTLFSKFTGMTVEMLHETFSKDVYFNAEEAMSYGIIDAIRPPAKPQQHG